MTGPIVADRDGMRYVLEGATGDSWLIWNPRTGERCHLPAETLERVADVAPLDAIADAFPVGANDLDGVPDRRALGLLLDIDASGPTGVRALLDGTALCESDLHGRLGEMQAAGLLREVRVAGERGYKTTESAAAAIEELR